MNFECIAMKNGIKVGCLKYGTIVSYNDTIYVKVDKNKLGMGLKLSYTMGYSVLFNPKLGTLREIKGNTFVDIMESIDDNIQVCRVSMQDQHKYIK